MRRILVCVAFVAAYLAGPTVLASDTRFGRERAAETKRASSLIANYFESDPLGRWDTVTSGAALDRLSYELSVPAWPGDRPGSLTARFDSSYPAGTFGFSLPERLDQDDVFSAAAIVVIEPEGFSANPEGFFQISWGLWNTETTGLNRSGNFNSFAADTFEALGFDYFPNVSPFFGGPFLSPTIFGVANTASPEFASQGAFANAGFAFGVEVELPLGEPLLLLLEHRADMDVVVFSVHRVVNPRRSIPVPGAVTVIELDGLPIREYVFDAVGLMLWNDGFGGSEPALLADVALHALIVNRDLFPSVDAILRVPPRRP